MLTRRSFMILAASIPMSLSFPLFGRIDEDSEDSLDELEYPSFDLINESRLFGNLEPTQEQYEEAKSIWENAPNGITPYDIAKYFLNFEHTKPEIITQWPKAKAWNPLIVEFFSSTNYQAKNDLVPWCAAFVNWCLNRSQRKTSGSPASQSFLNKNHFERIKNPNVGDLAVFTCYDILTEKSVGLGHVAFVAKVPKPTDTHILCLGGNQTLKRNSMVCMKQYKLSNVRTTRTIKKKQVNVNMRLNSYIRIS